MGLLPQEREWLRQFEEAPRTYVADLLQCAKPLMFKNNDAEFPYSMLGTCFLARYRSQRVIVTARHNLRTRTPDSIRIRLVSGKLRFLQPVHFFEPDSNEGDRNDFAIWTIDQRSVPADLLSSNHFLNLTLYEQHPVQPSPDALLAVIGYPSTINTIDYETSTFHTGGLTVDGRYKGPCLERECSIIGFNDISAIPDADGLSGSPVLQFVPTGENSYEETFAGVIIRGSASSRTGNFIDASAIYEGLKQVV